MDAALLLTALMMGLAGSLHCTAMCGAACTALATRCDAQAPRRALWGFHLGRLLSYAAGGAVLAAGVGTLGALAQASPVLRPLWTLVHAAALGLGLWLLWQGRQPVWLSQRNSVKTPTVAAADSSTPVLWHTLRGPTRALGAGSLWAAIPCGLLHSALLVAALAPSALSGAAVMATFALASSVGLALLPTLWWRSTGGRLTPATTRWVIRVSGLTLAAASAWAMGHGLMMRMASH